MASVEGRSDFKRQECRSMKGMCSSCEDLKGVAGDLPLRSPMGEYGNTGRFKSGEQSMKELPHSGEASTGDKSEPRRLGLWF